MLFVMLTSDRRLWAVNPEEKEYNYLGCLTPCVNVEEYLQDNPGTIQGELPDDYVNVR
jgi:hypothetical protein